MEEEPYTGADQVLTKIAILVGINLGAGVIEIFILDKGTKVGIEEVIGPGNNIPCQVCVTSPPASVDWGSAGHRVLDFDARRFGIVTADPGADIRLEP